MGGYRTTPAISFGPRITPAVKALIIANVVIFVASALFRWNLERTLFLGLVPGLVVRGMVWQPLTYMFLHASLGHILFNMLALWMFGSAVEGAWGRRRFLRYYLACGAGAGICVVLGAFLFGGAADAVSVTVGASGAIYGVLLAFGVMYPNAPVLMFLLFPVPAKYFVMIMGAISFFFIGTGSGGSVSHIAHLGGLVAGWLLLRSYRLAYPTSSAYRGSTRRAAFTQAFSYERWRGAYQLWKVRRRKKQFEVYLRKHPGGGSGPVN